MARNPTTWKAFERRVAKWLGGQRRGAHTGRGARGTGLSDVISDVWAPECKLLSHPSWSTLVGAAKQAEAAAGDLIPIAFVKKLGARDEDALVVMRLGTFREWFLNNEEAADAVPLEARGDE